MDHAKDVRGPEAGGCPLTPAAGAGAQPYVTYAHMDRLHQLQKPRTGSRRELTFLLVSHVKELLFRMVHVELVQARDELHADRVDAACASLSRAVRGQRVLVSTWDMMNGMTPDEFLEFRDVLGEASGTQSFMYRALEFVLGNKDPRTVRASAAHIELYPELHEALHTRSVYDEALALLSRQGADVPEDVLNREPAGQHSFNPEVEKMWLDVYRDPARWASAHRLAEALVEVSYQFSCWRATHLLVVERMLGGKPGTGGTTGLDWLRSISDHRFFPELWSVRTLL